MSVKNHYVTMKGTNDGIVVYLDDQCSFNLLLEELKDKLLTSQKAEETEIILHSQYRYLHQEQIDELKNVIEENSHFKIKKLDSYVLTIEEAQEWFEQVTLKKTIKTVRSGQVLQVTGDVLVIGDVNPGGMVIASGNVYVLGKLRGIAHAGYEGDTTCIVVASYMHPNQISISNNISHAPDYETESSEREFTFINLEIGRAHV